MEYTHCYNKYCILRSCGSIFLQNDVYLSLKIVFISANSPDPDSTTPDLTGGPSLLQKYLSTGIQNEKG